MLAILLLLTISQFQSNVFSQVHFEDTNPLFTTEGLQMSNTPTQVLDSLTDSLYLYERAYGYQQSDPALAYMYIREYVEQHPYATTLPGEVNYAIAESEGDMAQIPGITTIDYKKHYNWLLKIQPANMERSYQGTVMYCLAQTMTQWDYNGAANMWYNYGVIYGDWNTATENIKNIRMFQHIIGQDTTPFTVIKYPPDPLVLAGVKQPITGNTSVSFSIVPNPAALSASANIFISNSGVIILQLYDELGVKVKDIFSGYLQAGKQSVAVDIHELSIGEYYLRLVCPGGIATRKLVVNR